MYDQRNTLAAELESRACSVRARNFAPLAVVIVAAVFWTAVVVAIWRAW